MRVSAYEITLPLIGREEREIPGKTLLVSGLYGAMDVVPEEVAAALARGEADRLAPPIRERLLARGHITRKDEAGELADVKLLGRIHRKVFGAFSVTPVILPTYDCNFRCPYCFERHRLTRGTEWLRQRMSTSMIRAVFAALEKQRAKGRSVTECTLYGGEPLMAENRDVVEAICARAKDMDLEIGIVSNGYELDRYWDLLEQLPLSGIQITVDGVGELNDRRRLHRDGAPTYERILQNTREALRRGIDIKLRVNVDRENIGSLAALLEDLDARGLRGEKGLHLYFSPTDMDGLVRAASQDATLCRPPTTFAYGSSDELGCLDILAALLDAGESMKEAVQQVNAIGPMATKLWSLMEKKEEIELSPAFCGAEEGMMVIAPDGKIFPCWDFVGMDKEAVGWTDEAAGEFVLGLPTAFWRTRTVDLMEPCRTCPYLFLCQGGCAAKAKLETASPFRGHCGEIKKIVHFVLPRLAGRKWKEAGEKAAHPAPSPALAHPCASAEANTAHGENGIMELTRSLAEPLARLTEKERKGIMETATKKEIFSIVKEAGFFSKVHS